MFNHATKLVAIAILSGSLARGADTAQCGAHGQALKAENGLSPCEIAALLVGGGYMPQDSPYHELSDMGVDRYPIPSVEEANKVTCNPVIYNLVSGCAACQASTFTWNSWEAWTAHCRANTGVSYIASVMPYDTPLPNWAFTDPSVTDGTFNATLAKIAGDSSDTHVPDTTFNFKSEESANSNGSATVNKAAIAGGTGGGFALGLAIGIFGMLLAKKRTVKKRGSDQGSVHSHETQDTVAREKATFA